MNVPLPILMVLNQYPQTLKSPIKFNKPVLIENSTISSVSKPFLEKLIIFEDLSSTLKIGTFLFLIANISVFRAF